MPAVPSIPPRICSSRFAQRRVMALRSLSKSSCMSENFSTMASRRWRKRGPVRESQSERFRQHAPRAEENLCSDIGYVAVIKLALMAAPEQGLLADVARVSFQSEAVIWSGNQ